jgi:hypothetical protein
MTPVASTADRGLPIASVAVTLAAIALLALVVPYLLVSSLHQRRLDRADSELQALGASLRSVPSTSPVLFLAGRGDPPAFVDQAWAAVSPSPLSRVTTDPGPDPWGNSYLVVVPAGRPTVVISAGPDGILQTRFSSDVPAGDDRLLTVQ